MRHTGQDHNHPVKPGQRSGHPHAHGAAERYASRSHPEFVVLDIGEGVGALILHADRSMVGVEVEISAAGRDLERSHKEVLEREIAGRPAYTAVFDRIPEGSYTLWVDDRPRAREVLVTGGAVRELDWTGQPGA